MARIIILVLLAAVMLAAAIATWGSIGSIALLFCLVMMGAALLYQRFVTDRDGDDFQTEP